MLVQRKSPKKHLLESEPPQVKRACARVRRNTIPREFDHTGVAMHTHWQPRTYNRYGGRRKSIDVLLGTAWVESGEAIASCDARFASDTRTDALASEAVLSSILRACGGRIRTEFLSTSRLLARLTWGCSDSKRCFFGDFLCTSKESYPLARSDSGSSALRKKQDQNGFPLSRE